MSERVKITQANKDKVFASTNRRKGEIIDYAQTFGPHQIKTIALNHGVEVEQITGEFAVKIKNIEKVFDTGVHNIKVRVYNQVPGQFSYEAGELVSSDLLSDDANDQYNAAMKTIESMVLSHAVAGVAITEPDYLEGLETTIDSMANEFGD